VRSAPRILLAIFAALPLGAQSAAAFEPLEWLPLAAGNAWTYDFGGG